jgi:integrase
VRGYIRKRAKDTYSITVYLGRDPKTHTIRQKYATVRGTKEAESELTRMMREIDTGTDLEPGRVTVSEYFDHWLTVKQSKLKPRTHARYSELLRHQVTPVIGDVRLAKLRPLHLETVQKKARENHLSEQTLLHIHRVIFTALRQAVKRHLVARNVAEAIETPKPRRKRVSPLDPADAVRILNEVADTDLEIPVIIALGTGMRRGEVLGLRWIDVDLDAATARITQTIQNDGSIGTPKTHRSERPVSLPPFAVDTLRRLRKDQTKRRLVCGAAWRDLDLVVDRGDGRPLDPTTVSKRFRAVTRQLNLDLTYHGLRHGFATLALVSGTDLKVTQHLLGHSTYHITADLYTHVAEKADQQAAARLDALLFGSDGQQMGK